MIRVRAHLCIALESRQNSACKAVDVNPRDEEPGSSRFGLEREHSCLLGGLVVLLGHPGPKVQ